jgi:hypothetical protein
MKTKAKRLNVRVEPALHDRIRLVAEKRFEGNEAMAFRDALETYAELRERLGVDFDRRITELLEQAA